MNSKHHISSRKRKHSNEPPVETKRHKFNKMSCYRGTCCTRYEQKMSGAGKGADRIKPHRDSPNRFRHSYYCMTPGGTPWLVGDAAVPFHKLPFLFYRWSNTEGLGLGISSPIGHVQRCMLVYPTGRPKQPSHIPGRPFSPHN